MTGRTMKKIILSEKDMPEAWYNVQADLDVPLAPPLHPATHEPLKPGELEQLFPRALIEQEMSRERWIEIPDDVQKILRIWRPSPLVRATEWEKDLGTPARIYFKNESLYPPGSHKPNTAVAQAYYNKEAGVKKITTETGAGQWGSALAFATGVFGLECTVYMVRVSYKQKPYRKSLMHVWGAEVIPSPSETTESGREILARDPDTPGSLGMAISEAVEVAAANDDTCYSLGSVLNHVLLHQTVEGLEAVKQLRLVDDKADVIIGCVGGGSNFAGLAFPYVPEKLKGREVKLLGVEPHACPTVTRGEFRYDFGDTARRTPLLKMHTLGHTFVPPGLHAGGLRYHGMAPLVSHLKDRGIVESVAYHQNECFKAAVTFARAEGHIPAPETAHALRAVEEEALKCKETGEEKCIVVLYSGHGHFDMGAYDRYLAGELQDYAYPEESIKQALKELPEIS